MAMGKREVGAAFLCMGNAAVRFGGAVGAAPPVKTAQPLGVNRYQDGVRDSSRVRVASEITLRSQRTSSE